jgi:cytochrome c
MDSFEFNKIAGAVLACVLFVMIIGKVSGMVVHPHIPEKPAIAVPDEPAATGPATAGPAKAPPLPEGGDAAAGKTVFTKVCATCHTADQGGRNGQGPNLFGAAGGKRPHNATFAFTPALQAKGGEWTYEDLNHMIFKPTAFVRGTKMAYAGLAKEQDRADLIAFLRTMADQPKPLP